jgi:hypothetical protein
MSATEENEENRNVNVSADNVLSNAPMKNESPPPRNEPAVSSEETGVCHDDQGGDTTLVSNPVEEVVGLSAKGERATLAIKKVDSSGEDMKLCSSTRGKGKTLAIKTDEDTKLCIAAKSETETPASKAVDSSCEDTKRCSSTSGEAESLAIKMDGDTKLCTAKSEAETPSIKAVDSSCEDMQLYSATSGEANSLAIKKATPPMKMESSSDDVKLSSSSEDSKLCSDKGAKESVNSGVAPVADTTVGMAHPPEVLSNEQAAVSSDIQVRPFVQRGSLSYMMTS